VGQIGVSKARHIRYTHVVAHARKMRVSILLLLTTTSLTFGQVKDPMCLDMDTQFELFVPQIKYNSKIKEITNLDKCMRDSVYIRMNFNRNVRYDNDIKGIAIEILNTTDKDFEFNNSAFQDFFCQVKYKGDWLTIERNQRVMDCVPRSLVIPTNRYVTAILPCYKGTETVTMRYRFAIDDRVMYSEEFTGTINLGLLK